MQLQKAIILLALLYPGIASNAAHNNRRATKSWAAVTTNVPKILRERLLEKPYKLKLGVALKPAYLTYDKNFADI